MECLVGVLVYAIFAVVVLAVLEAILGYFGVPYPAPLVRLLIGLLVLIYALGCIMGLLGIGPPVVRWR